MYEGGKGKQMENFLVLLCNACFDAAVVQSCFQTFFSSKTSDFSLSLSLSHTHTTHATCMLLLLLLLLLLLQLSLLSPSQTEKPPWLMVQRWLSFTSTRLAKGLSIVIARAVGNQVDLALSPSWVHRLASLGGRGRGITDLAALPRTSIHMQGRRYLLTKANV